MAELGWKGTRSGPGAITLCYPNTMSPFMETGVCGVADCAELWRWSFQVLVCPLAVLIAYKEINAESVQCQTTCASRAPRAGAHSYAENRLCGHPGVLAVVTVAR